MTSEETRRTQPRTEVDHHDRADGSIADLSSLRTKRIVLVLVAFLFVGWIVWSARGALSPFVFGAVLAYLLAPFVNLFARALPMRGRLEAIRQPVAILLTYALALVVLILVGLYFIPSLINQTVEFADTLPSYWDDVQRESVNMQQWYMTHIPESVRQRIEGNLDAATEQLSTAVRSALMLTFNAVGTVIGLAAGIALLPLWMFYVLKDQRRGMVWFYQLWPEPWRDDVRNIVRIVDEVLAAYVRVQLLLGVIIGVVTGLAMWAIGVQQSLVLGLIAGIFELIPVLGPWLAFIVAALVTLATDPGKLILVALAFLGIQQLENTFLVPKLQGDAVRIHPALVMILLVIGGSLWGVIGMIVVVPLTAVVRDIFVYLYGKTEPS